MKRLLSLILVLVMILSLLPLSALATAEEAAAVAETVEETAEDAAEETVEETTEESAEEMVEESAEETTEGLTEETEETTGETAEKVPVTLDGEDDVAASGTCGENLTWTLTSDGVLTIRGTGAMEDYARGDSVPWYSVRETITTLVIEKGVTNIGGLAFCVCTALTKLTIPDSVTSIGVDAFYMCTALKNIAIPDSVTNIGIGAFWDCTSLTSITIPDSVTSIGDYAFYDCTALTSITIPDSVTSIGDYAFSGCTALTSITIPDSVTSIGIGAFECCTSLTDVYYSGSEEQWNAISIDDDNDCLTSATIHYNWDGTESKDAFVYLEDMEIIASGRYTGNQGDSFINVLGTRHGTTDVYGNQLEHGLEAWIARWNYKTEISWAWAEYALAGDYTTLTGKITVLSDCVNTSTFDSTIEILGDGVLLYSSALTAGMDVVTVEVDVTGVDTLRIYVYDNTASKGGTAFALWDFAVSNGDIEANVVDSGACGDNVTWTLTSDGTLTISGTGPMEDYSDDSNAPWHSHGDDILRVLIEAGITSIGDDAFILCTSLTGVAIPSSVTSIGEFSFDGCTSLMDITIPDSVTNIDAYAFAGCSSLTNIAIPNGVTSIEEGSFYGCTALEFVTFGSGVTNIGSGSFEDCTSLTSITIPDSVTNIEAYAFAKCSSLTSITIPDTIESIGRFAFYGCPALTNVYYRGTEEQWNEIDIGSYNDCLTGATIYYNCYLSVNLSSEKISDLYAYETKDNGDTYYRASYVYEITAEIENHADVTAENVVATLDLPDELVPIDAESLSRSLGDIASEESVCTTWTVYADWPEESVSAIYGVTANVNQVASLRQESYIYLESIKENDHSIIFGIDQWRFSNAGNYFTNGVKDENGKYIETYYITDTDYQALISRLGNLENARVNFLLNSNWGGSCYGMSSTAVLTKMGVIQPENIAGGGDSLYSFVKTNNDDLESFINFYLAQQMTNSAQNIVSAFMRKSTKTQLATIEEMASQVSAGGYPFVLCFYGDGWGHAVVAYGVEHGDYSVGGFLGFGASKYDSRILLYDCNYPDETSYLYYNTGTDEWKFQNYSDATKLGFACNDVSILDYVDYGTAVSNYYAQLFFTGDVQKYSLLYGGQTTSIDASTDDRENGLVTYFAPNLMADGTYAEGNMVLTLPDLTSDYSVIPEAGACDFALYYENSAVSAVCDGAEQIDFNADGGVSASGVSGEYTLSLVFDDGYSTSPWYETTVSGYDAEDVSLTQVEDGILIEGDNLQDVEITVTDEDETLTLKLSTDDDSALLVSLTDEEENKPVILLDTDGDGDYETEYEPVTVSGDFTGDGEVTILDVLALLKHVAGISTITGNGDVNNDGVVSILDVLQLLKYVAGIAGTTIY